MKAPSFVRLQIKRKWSSLVFLPVNSCVSNSRVWIVFLIEPQAFFFFSISQSQINALTLWLHSHDCMPAATSWSWMIFMSAQRTGHEMFNLPSKCCGLCLLVCVLYSCVMTMRLFRGVGVSIAANEKHFYLCLYCGYLQYACVYTLYKLREG